MKRLSLATLTFIGFSILACSGGSEEGTTTSTEEAAADEGTYEEGEIEAEDLPEVAITEPWKSMNLPLSEDGQVALSDDTMLLIAYDGKSVTALNNVWPSAIEAQGWVKDWEDKTETFTAIIYKKAGSNQQIGLAIGTDEAAPDVTFVYMEDLDKVPEEKSTTRNAKKAGKPVKIHSSTATVAKRKTTGGSNGGGGKKNKGGKGKNGKGKGKGGKND